MLLTLKVMLTNVVCVVTVVFARQEVVSTEALVPYQAMKNCVNVKKC